MGIYDDFVEDYNNLKLTVHDIMRLNHLHSKQYYKLKKQAVANGDITPKRHMNRNHAKFYTKNGNNYIVKKTINKKQILVGNFPDVETAELIVNKCKEVDWELDCISDLIEKHKVKPANYSLVNGYYVIQKVINGENKVFYTVNSDECTESLIQNIVEYCRLCDWDVDCRVNIPIEFGV